MIVKIPNDIFQYSNKAIGNFSLRQIICLSASLIVITPVFLLLFLVLKLGTDISAITAMLLGLPIASCGFFNKHGIYLEQIIKYKIDWRFKYSRQRRYVMRNLYEDIENIKIEKESNIEQSES